MTGKSNPFAATAVFMNRQKNLMIFNFTIFPSNLKKKKMKKKKKNKKKTKKKKKKQIKIYVFLNHFSILTALFLNTLTSKRFLNAMTLNLSRFRYT